MSENLSKAKKRDAVLRTMLRTPPDPHEMKPKKHRLWRGPEKALKGEGREAFGKDDPNWGNGEPKKQ